ncbi:Ribonucleotide reductase of class II (coenzyme B12-dependent) [Acidisarcina polymorpha]|uniref:Vitamin B12-dependent ribonucleotide reductase n=1 Tax=Acidisarcina polymorpha TaxID=2211140 RepID=A0A2Z5FX63_9BACT|nr:vitamin B12-dependent ribonucleotide reductase [Acidisarcina polymorpha]AXC11468.1 Ribonucleotide reductase of class II (coenzyme B12-dependent) [Acidisarcina polymorpha]
MAEATTRTNPTNGATAIAEQPTRQPAAKKAEGLRFHRVFSKPGVSPYGEVQWERRTASITDATGKSIFEQKDVEVPVDWSMTATNIVASKYLHGQLGTPERESGVRALVSRVAETIRDWGMNDGYFATPEDAALFHDELVHLLVNQKVAFNSPVWFNVGCDRLEPNSDAQNWHYNPHTCAVEFSVTGYRNPQCSACFINAVDDSLDSILTLAKTEGMLFKWGSGTGSNLSPIRGSMELLSGGGTASGPLSFMRGFDAFAGVIKSGGKTRRAAKMVILNVDHPDIIEFIECKSKEEAKAWALMQAGYDGSSGPDSEAYSSIFFQNANNSVRVTDEFMQAVERDGDFTVYTVKDHLPVKTYKARDIMKKIAEATWQCGDPGMQYDTTINKWHTSKNSGRINASNPCSEYMFLDNSACNLASFNLLKFVDHAGNFDIASYRHAIGIMITAMDILVDNSGYPTEWIGRNSHDYRPLGLGYANLGALLMSFGLPYDSDAGRDFAATLTSIMCGEAYLQSSKIAESCPPLASTTPLTANAERTGGACPGFYVNREPFLDVIRMHRAEVNNIGKTNKAVIMSGNRGSAESRDLNGRVATETFVVPQLDALIDASRDCWDKALAHGEKHGYRNSQVTVLAPTGTIGFMMDCDTTGIEPDLALVKYKKLVGGGMIKIVNNTVPAALFKLGYTNDQVDAIVSYIDATGTIEGAPGVKPEHLAVFDCSFKPSKGTRSIHYTGHVKMMAATQPFLSGAISKTVNLPHDCTLEDIAEAYLDSWRLGLKAVAVYRDGSKGAQPLNVSDGKGAKEIKTSKDSSGKDSPIDVLNQAADRVLASLVQGKPGSESDLKTLEAKVSDKLEVTSRSILAAASAFTEALQKVVTLSEAERSGAQSKDLDGRNATNLFGAQGQDPNSPPRAVRHRLPAERASLTHKFSLGGHEGYITVGLYPSGEPGEIFIKMAKEGSTVSGLMDSFATAISLSLQHGVPLKVLCEKFAHTRFEPSGWTGNEHIGYAKSIMDYIFRWLQLRFLSGQQLSLFTGLGAAATAPLAPLSLADEGGPSQDKVTLNEGGESRNVILSEAKDLQFSGSGAGLTPDQHQPTRGMGATNAPQGGIAPSADVILSEAKDLRFSAIEDRGIHHAADAMRSMYDMGDAPSCHTCGAIMVRNGSCYRCMSCGSTSGCS